MSYNSYNNNPDAKNYSNCDISGSFYAVGPATASGPTGATAAVVTAGSTGAAAAAAVASGQAEKCECIGTCSKKNS